MKNILLTTLYCTALMGCLTDKTKTDTTSVIQGTPVSVQTQETSALTEKTTTDTTDTATKTTTDAATKTTTDAVTKTILDSVKPTSTNVDLSLQTTNNKTVTTKQNTKK